jgi:hypothetical protein
VAFQSRSGDGTNSSAKVDIVRRMVGEERVTSSVRLTSIVPHPSSSPRRRESISCWCRWRAGECEHVGAAWRVPARVRQKPIASEDGSSTRGNGKVCRCDVVQATECGRWPARDYGQTASGGVGSTLTRQGWLASHLAISRRGQAREADRPLDLFETIRISGGIETSVIADCIMLGVDRRLHGITCQSGPNSGKNRSTDACRSLRPGSSS